jgi:hypothetical protein
MAMRFMATTEIKKESGCPAAHPAQWSNKADPSQRLSLPQRSALLAV